MKSLVLALLFLLSGYSHASSQTCLTDSLYDSGDPAANVSQGVIMASAKWLPGQTLRVRFLDRNDYFETRVRQHAREWERHANIKFAFVESGEADIRISFRLQRDAYWSLVGKESKVYSLAGDGRNGIRGYPGSDGTSMNLGWPEDQRNEDAIRATTLHEFGHALGLLHEHQNVNRPFDWNTDAVVTKYRRYGWSLERIREQVLNYYGRGSKYTNKAYDPHSVMHYPVEANLTQGGFAVGYNTNLSAGDKAVIREMYPPADPAPTAFSFNDIAVEHNVFEGGEKGMKIKMDFTISGEYRQRHRMVAYFQSHDGRPLKDLNNKLNTASGGVSASEYFTPNYERTRFKTFTLFMPYSELHTGCGDHRLKFYFNVWKGEAIAAVSGYSYFTYRKPCPGVAPPAVGAALKHGPAELPASVYPTSDRKSQLRLRATTVTSNNDAEVARKVAEIMNRPGSHVWDGNWYYYRLAAGSKLLLAWQNLGDNMRGWVLVQRHEGAWWFKTNTGQWKKLSGDAEEPHWVVGGGRVVIGIKLPRLEGSWTANDVLYRFAY